MSTSVTAKVKDLSFDIKMKNNKLIIPFESDILDLQRFFPEVVKKYADISEEDFGDLGVGGSFMIEIDCTINEDSEYMIQEIDGKTGLETWIDSVTDEDLRELILTIYEDSVEIFKKEIPLKELSKEEERILSRTVADKVFQGDRDVIID